MKLLILTLALIFGTITRPAAASPQNETSLTPQQSIDKIKADTAAKQADTERYKAEQDAIAAERKAELDRLAAETAAKAADTDAKAADNAAAKDQRQAEIDKINARKDLITAATPTFPDGPKGTVTFDDKGVVTIENTVKAYQAAEKAAALIAPEIYRARPDSSTYIILNPNDVAAVTSLTVFEAQADAIKDRLKRLADIDNEKGLRIPEISASGTKSSEKTTPAEALALVGPAITALTGLIGLFKVDDKYTTKDETTDLPALYGIVAAKMQGHGTVYFPEILPPGFLSDTSSVQKRLLEISEKIDELRTIYISHIVDKNRATKEASDLDARIKAGPAVLKTRKEIEDLKKEIAGLSSSAAHIRRRREKLTAQVVEKEKSLPSNAVETKEELDGLIEFAKVLKAYLHSNDKYIAMIEPVLKAGDDYITAMTKSDAITTAPLATLIAAERIRCIYKANRETFAIQLSVQRISGTRKEHSNFFGTSISFSGGIVASYRVFESESGKLVASGTVPVILGFEKK